MGLSLCEDMSWGSKEISSTFNWLIKSNQENLFFVWILLHRYVDAVSRRFRQRF